MRTEYLQCQLNTWSEIFGKHAVIELFRLKGSTASIHVALNGNGLSRGLQREPTDVWRLVHSAFKCCPKGDIKDSNFYVRSTRLSNHRESQRLACFKRGYLYIDIILSAASCPCRIEHFSYIMKVVYCILGSTATPLNLTFPSTFHFAGVGVEIIVITPDRSNSAIHRDGRLYLIVVAGSGGGEGGERKWKV